jgi:Prion-inhibition and propagation
VTGGKPDSSITKKTLWVVHDRKKFDELVSELKDLIDGLQDITKTISTAIRQERILTHRIQQIEEVETLHMVSSVCEIDTPWISDAASVKLEVLSLASTRRGEIEPWTDEVPDSDFIPSDTESLTITELKQIVRRFMDDEGRVQRVTRADSGLSKKEPVEFDEAIAYINKIKVNTMPSQI